MRFTSAACLLIGCSNAVYGFNSFGIFSAQTRNHAFVSSNNNNICSSENNCPSPLSLSAENGDGSETPAAAVEEIPAAVEETVAVPPAGFSISSDNSGPASSMVHTLTVNLGASNYPDPLVIQSGKIARQAAGSVTLQSGDTLLLATAARDDKPKDNIDFLPLSVEHSERFSSAGLTSGSYNKRDGRPAEHEILTCRLIDRPIRPIIPSGWRHETQLLSWVLSYDGLRGCDALAITSTAAALWLSDVPMSKPVAGVEVGIDADTGNFLLNPTIEEMAKSPLKLIVAGTKDAVLMIEGAADFLSEQKMMEGVTFGQQAIATICEALEEFGKVAGKPKNTSTLPQPIPDLQQKIDDLMTERVDALYGSTTDKDSHSSQMSILSKALMDETAEEFPDPDYKIPIKSAFKDLLCRRMYHKAKETGTRVDGRRLDEVRTINVEAGFLPSVHGSALFSRGETQAIATATLGDKGMQQKIDTLEGTQNKRFYLQYTFPPSCVGETGRVGMPGRREVGHGNLAERALIPSLPSEQDFPYVIRLESLITESHGSSSMASVCGGSLALMDAGVPVKAPVAGIAMGMLLGDSGGLSDETAVIVSDILGTEDALGTMDFKVAGDKDGITTFQLDIKCEGLTLETMSRALEQARQGRLHILEEMGKTLNAPRGDLPDTVPKMLTFKIDQETIGKVIGPGGKQIRAIIEDFGLTNMNVDEDGLIQLSSMNTTTMKSARDFTENLVKGGGGGRGGGGRGGDRGPRVEYAGPKPEVGAIYKGKIKGIHQFGVFVEIMPGAEDGSTPGLEGLCHISELHVERVRNCEGFINSMGTDELEVKLLAINEKGQLQLSRKATMQKNKSSGGGAGEGGRRGPPRVSPPNANGDAPTQTRVEMPKAESDVIASAIEGIDEIE